MFACMTPGTSSEFEHFLEAQNGVYDQVVEELTRGQKRSHWMWFIFPQVRGLGRSAMARRFAIHCLDQARRYAHHILLGQRLRQCTRLVLDVQGREISDILGCPDDLKFRSSMTLFEIAACNDNYSSRSATIKNHQWHRLSCSLFHCFISCL